MSIKERGISPEQYKERLRQPFDPLDPNTPILAHTQALYNVFTYQPIDDETSEAIINFAQRNQ